MINEELINSYASSWIEIPNGIVLIKTIDGEEHIRHAVSVKLGPKNVSVAYELDGGDSPDDWGTPLILQNTINYVYLGTFTNFLNERFSKYSEYRSLFFKNFKNMGMLPLIRCLYKLDKKSNINDFDVKKIVKWAVDDYIFRNEKNKVMRDN